MRTNVPVACEPVVTHEGGPAVRLSALKELRRSVMAAMLWEDTFYESGSAHAARVAALVPRCDPSSVAELAVQARDRMHLRHVPLFLIRELARVKGNGRIVADALDYAVQRPDELCEYLSIYWGGPDRKKAEPLSAGSKRGLARAFARFGEYELAKYDRSDGVKLRDVLRLTHPRPEGGRKGPPSAQSLLWHRVVSRELETPDTWEVALSGGADKRETFERLLRERKLGGLAFLRNLRNMVDAGVDATLIRGRFASGAFARVLPFRFLAALRHAPAFAQEINDAMLRAVAGEPRLAGRTAVLVDVSDSMNAPLSRKSDLQRSDAAAGLAILLRELCADCRVYTFSDRLVEVPSLRGVALVPGLKSSQENNGTYLGNAVRALNADCARYDRLVVITDEQSADRVPSAMGHGYMINIATDARGVGDGPWTRISGWSERVVDYVREAETVG